jgi:hypothetical protein
VLIPSETESGVAEVDDADVVVDCVKDDVLEAVIAVTGNRLVVNMRPERKSAGPASNTAAESLQQS